MAYSGDAIDLRKAMLDPTAVFRGPEDVLQRDELTREQKIEILRRWEYDALELQVAEEENMGSEQSSDILDRVLHALRALNAGPDPEHSPPTKRGGV